MIASTLDFVYATGTMRPMADPNADYWTVGDVAEHWGVTPQTIRTYRSRKRGELPEPDRMFGRSPVWRPSTITEFQRPGRGARTDLKPAPANGPGVDDQVEPAVSGESETATEAEAVVESAPPAAAPPESCQQAAQD